MKQNNIFNRFFCKETLKKEKEKYEKCKSLVGHYTELRERIDSAKTLEDLLTLHKKAWGLGYRNQNLGPCEYGVFRTKDISEMKPEEVFLGNVYGLWTFPIPKWNDQKDQCLSKDSEVTIYDIVANQYRRILTSNLRNIWHEANDFVERYEELNPQGSKSKILW